MARVRSYTMLLDLECDALVLDIFHDLLAPIKDDHSLILAHIRFILVGIVDEADDLVLEFLISIVSWSQAMARPSSIAQVMSKKSIRNMCISDFTTTTHFIYR